MSPVVKLFCWVWLMGICCGECGSNGWKFW